MLEKEEILEIVKQVYPDAMFYEDNHKEYIVGGQIFDELCKDEDDDCFVFKKTIKQLQKFKTIEQLKTFLKINK